MTRATASEIMRFKDLPPSEGMEVSEEWGNKVMHAELELPDGQTLYFSDTFEGGDVTFGDAVAVHVNVESEEEVHRYFNALAEGGRVTMPAENSSGARSTARWSTVSASPGGCTTRCRSRAAAALPPGPHSSILRPRRCSVPIPLQPDAQALIFDLDGTLLDSMPVHRIAWRETCETFGFPMSDEEFDRLGGLTSEQMIAALEADAGRVDGPAVDATELTLHKAQAYVRHLDVVQPFADVLELAERAYGTLPLAVATNEALGVATIALRTKNLTHLFSVMVAGDEVQRPKPAPDIYIECARRLGLEPAVCQVFEDTDHGVAAARAAGMMVTDVREYRR